MFSTGDKVRIKDTDDDVVDFEGLTGIIIGKGNKEYEFEVQLEDGNGQLCFNPNELELVEE